MKYVSKDSKNSMALDKFIIEVSLIDPVSKIVNQLKNREFRDCDIRWLDTKLEKFTEFACKTLRITATIQNQVESERSGIVSNDFVVTQYIRRFITLLEYFKSF